MITNMCKDYMKLYNSGMTHDQLMESLDIDESNINISFDNIKII